MDFQPVLRRMAGADGGGGKFHAEEIGHRLGEAILRRQVQRMDREGCDPGSMRRDQRD